VKDHYQTLGLSTDATPDQIKKAYRRLAKQHHPDRNPGDPAAEARFKEVSEAYTTLSDPRKRTQYDAQREMRDTGGFNVAQNPHGGFSVSFDIGEIFGRRPRGANIRAAVDVTLDEVLRGAAKQVSVTSSAPCGACCGTGAGTEEQSRTCNCCAGYGKVEKAHIFGRMVAECPACRGSGRQPGRGCPSCGGSGAVSFPKTVRVSIPPGISDGQVVRVRGAGHFCSDGQPGDLHLTVRVRPHPAFERRGDDLWMDIRVPFPTMAMGGKTGVRTLDGEVSLDIPAGTQSGQAFRLSGRGLPRLRGGRGHMVVRAVVDVPTALSDEQKEILREFRDAEG